MQVYRKEHVTPVFDFVNKVQQMKIAAHYFYF